MAETLTAQEIKERLDDITHPALFDLVATRALKEYGRIAIEKVRKVIQDRKHIVSGRMYKSVEQKPVGQNLVVQATVPYAKYVDRHSRRRHGTGFIEKGVMDSLPELEKIITQEYKTALSDAYKGK